MGITPRDSQVLSAKVDILAASAGGGRARPHTMQLRQAAVRRRTQGQNHKKHAIALLVLFVSKKGTNRGIKCQFDILEKNPKGGPFYVKNFFISDFTQVSCANFLGHKDSKHEI